MRLAIAATLALLSPAFAQEAATWLTDFEAAKAAAKKDNRLILANFTGSDWCGWCIKLKSEVFSQPEFATWAGTKAVLLELDFPRQTELPAELKEQNAKLAKEHGVTGYPTVLVLNAEGKQVGKLGYKAGGPAAWIKAAEEQMAAKPAADAGGEHGDWMTDYAAALKKAKKEKKVVIADFTGSDWCGWCIKLKNEVFDQQEFKDWAQANAVLLEIDFPNKKKLPDALKEQNEKLGKEFKIEGYPTIVFLDGNGKELGRGGYEKGGPAAWIAMAEKEAGIKSKKPKPAKK
jgi:protein disulfide-isomerase